MIEVSSSKWSRIPGRSKKRKTEKSQVEPSCDFSQICSEGLETLLETLKLRGSYHPTEDVQGLQKAFLERIADSAMCLPNTAGRPSEVGKLPHGKVISKLMALERLKAESLCFKN